MSEGSIHVFISSTSKDLAPYREAAIEVCSDFGVIPEAMEFFEAMSAGAVEGSRRKVEKCQLYVGFFAHRYGHIAEGDNIGVTEHEYNHAQTCGIPSLCFLVDPDHPWPGKKKEPHQDKLAAFKAGIDGTFIRDEFTTPESLKHAIWKALRGWFGERAPELQRHLDSGRKPFPAKYRTPAKLLTARYEVVPFDEKARQNELNRIESWCKDDESTRVQLITGPGGSGKTRLMIEVIRRREAAHWIAGFLPEIVDTTQIPDLLATGPPRLLVVDYASTRFEFVRELLKRLARRDPKARPKIRLVLAARDQGDWWDQLLDQQGDLVEDLLVNRSEDPFLLSPLAEKEPEREAAFRLAAQEFADRQNKTFPDPLPIPDLDGKDFERALYLHMAALAAVDGVQIQNAQDALRRTLDHERIFWRQAAEEIAGNNPARRDHLKDHFEVTVTALTLAGGTANPEETRQFLAPFLATLEKTDNLPKALTTRLRNLYPAPNPRHLQGLQPDLLGEELVRQVLANPNHLNLLTTVLDTANLTQRANTLTVLWRIQQDLDPDSPWIIQALRTHLEHLLELPVRLNDNTLGHVLSESLEREADSELAARIENRCIQDDYLRSVPLREVACTATRIALTASRQMGEKATIEQLRVAARLSSNLGYRLSDLGRREEALDATDQAVENFRQLAKADSDAFLPDLATGLNNLGSDLISLGRYEAALEATQEAVKIRRQLSEARPEAFLPDLASSLNNLGASLSLFGLRKEALEATQEAVETRRLLSQARPEAFLPDLAGSLNNLGNRLSDFGFREEALEATQEAVETYRLLSQGRPDAFLPDLAMSLTNLGSKLSDLGRSEEALAPTLEAVITYRQHSQARPAAFLPDFATSLDNLGLRLSALGRGAEGLEALQEAVEIRRQLSQARPDVFLPSLAMSLNNLGNMLSAPGRGAEALEPTQEAVDTYRALSQSRPDAFLPDLAMSLWTLSRVLNETEPSQAFSSLGEGLGILTPLLQSLPQACGGQARTMVWEHSSLAERAEKEVDSELLAPILDVLSKLSSEPEPDAEPATEDAP